MEDAKQLLGSQTLTDIRILGRVGEFYDISLKISGKSWWIGRCSVGKESISTDEYLVDIKNINGNCIQADLSKMHSGAVGAPEYLDLELKLVNEQETSVRRRAINNFLEANQSGNYDSLIFELEEEPNFQLVFRDPSQNRDAWQYFFREKNSVVNTYEYAPFELPALPSNIAKQYLIPTARLKKIDNAILNS